MNGAKEKSFRLKRQFSLVGHNADCVELRSGVWNPIAHFIQDETKNGQLFNILCSLDGSQTVAQIAKQHGVKRSDVEALMDHLLNLGVIDDGELTIWDYYLSELRPTLPKGGDVHSLEDMNKPVIWFGEGEVLKRLKQEYERLAEPKTTETPEVLLALLRELQSSDKRWMDDVLSTQTMLERFRPWGHCFFVLAQDTIDPWLAQKFNRLAHALNISWLYVALDGPYIFIGPLLTGKRGPCFNCFETRVCMNLRESKRYIDYKNALVARKVVYPNDHPLNKLMSSLAASHGLFEIINYLLTGYTFTQHKVLSIYLPTFEIAFNEVLRFSGCTVCGSVASRDANQLYFDFSQVLQQVDHAN